MIWCCFLWYCVWVCAWCDLVWGCGLGGLVLRLRFVVLLLLIFGCLYWLSASVILGLRNIVFVVCASWYSCCFDSCVCSVWCFVLGLSLLACSYRRVVCGFIGLVCCFGGLCSVACLFSVV